MQGRGRRKTDKTPFLGDFAAQHFCVWLASKKLQEKMLLEDETRETSSWWKKGP